MSAPLPVPPVEAILAKPRRVALDAFLAAGWRPYARPLGLDAERARLLNIDLSEPDVAYERDGDLAAVAHVETDLEGLVTHVEVVGAEPADPVRIALALLGEVGPPRTGGGADAREWVWGPESGATATAGGEPVRLWMCAERAHGDRLWLVATLVRRS
ncbi:MAG TPA: hypothetical protein VF912_03765 [Anaeromyxobacter sp.]